MTGVFRFDEQWMGTVQTDALAGLARNVTHLPEGEYVEIGTWQGWSAIPIARAIAPAALHVVDHWQGDGAAIPAELVARDNYGIFLANVAVAKDLQPNLNVTVHKMGWRDWVAGWDKPIRFLHLDAAHTTVEVRDNIAAVLPFMMAGAVLCGDDWDWPDVELGIRAALPGVEPWRRFDKLWWVALDGHRVPRGDPFT